MVVFYLHSVEVERTIRWTNIHDVNTRHTARAIRRPRHSPIASLAERFFIQHASKNENNWSSIASLYRVQKETFEM